MIRFHDDVITLPTKTRPKKLTLMGSDGRRHTLLFKGSEDLRMDQRVMQLIAHVNTALARKMQRCDGLRGRVYAVVPVAARSGLIQWVDHAASLFSLYRVSCNVAPYTEPRAPSRTSDHIASTASTVSPAALAASYRERRAASDRAVLQPHPSCAQGARAAGERSPQGVCMAGNRCSASYVVRSGNFSRNK